MNWRSQKLHILGLEKKEQELLMLMEEPVSIKELSLKSPLPRTTIFFITNKLIERGLVEKVQLGKRFKYYSISAEKLKLMLRGALDVENGKVQFTSNRKISYFHGLKNIVQLQAEFLSSFSGERVYAIQPNKSWKSLHSKVDLERIIHVNQIIKSNELIVDAIIEHDAYLHFKTFNKNKRKFVKFTKSFGDRMADYVSAPKGYLTDHVEMWIIQNTTLFIDWHEEVAIKIIDVHMTHFLLDMFKIAKEVGEKIDHNQAITKILE